MARGGWVAARERAERGAQGGDGEVLWGDKEEEVAGEAEGWQEEDAPVREGRDSAGGVHCGVEDGWVRDDKGFIKENDQSLE